MAAMPVARCAEIARRLDEPMAGSAPSARRWLCLERPEAWSADINQDRDPVVKAFLARAAKAGFKPLLIRRTDGGPERPRVFLADTTPGGAATTVLDAGRLDDLPLPEPDHPLPGDPATGPLFLICTHEQRDPCCGVDGRALARALAGPGVFEASHLGGHRFAATALVLPTGYVYGRLDPGAATSIRAAASAGEVVTERCRGRSTWSSRGQVAEIAVREATGLRSPDALVVDDDSGDAVHVHTSSGERWAVDVESVDVDAIRPASCGARPSLMVPLRASSVRALQAGH
jgi:hypothetical protein